MTHSTPLIMGNPKGAPHSTFVDTSNDPTSGYYDDDVAADSGITPAPRPTEMRFHDTMPSMPAPLYGTATGQHRPIPRNPWPLLITAIALVGLCAAPFIFFLR